MKFISIFKKLKKTYNNYLLTKKFNQDIRLIKKFGSNHPKRNIKNFSNKYFPEKNIKQKIFIVGDSHCEYYGRNFKFVQKNYNINFYSIWSGPTLLINFANNKNLIIETFEKIKKINDGSKIIVIFTFGEIDIRTAFYKLIYIYKIFKNENELINHYLISLKNMVAFIEDEIAKKIVKCKIKVYFKEITPTTQEIGYTPKNLTELNKILKKNPFPVLGLNKKRRKWHEALNNKIKNINLKRFKVGKKY